MKQHELQYELVWTTTWTSANYSINMNYSMNYYELECQLPYAKVRTAVWTTPFPVLNNPWPCTELIRYGNETNRLHKCIRVSYIINMGCLLHVYNIPSHTRASVGFVTIQFPVFVSQYSPAIKAAKPALVPNKPPIPYIPRVLSTGVKRPTEALSWPLNYI